MVDRMELGTRGEELARHVVTAMGFQILETNFRCRTGEIDIIARRGNCYHFVEVKTRMGDAFGHPAEAVNERKQLKLVQVAKYYLHMRQIENVRVQFDVVEIEVNLLMSCI